MKQFKVTLFDNSEIIIKGHRMWNDTVSASILREKEVIVYGEGKYNTVALYPLEQLKSIVEM